MEFFVTIPDSVHDSVIQRGNTHASLLLRQGIHPKIVQERLGHSGIAITLDTYSHVAPGLQKAAALKFDEAVAVRHNSNAVSESR